MKALLGYFFPLTWVTAANHFAVVYLIVNILVISNPGGLFTTLRSFLPVIWASSVVFLAVLASSHYVSEWLSGAYRKLSFMYKAHWNLRVMSTTHALVVSALAVTALCDENVRVDLLESWSPVVGMAVAIFLGYCVLDTYMTLFYHDDELGGGVAIIMHHAMAIMISLYPLSAKRFGMITACYLLNELSTPFMNMIHFFRDAGIPKTSTLAVANSIAFLVAYFFCRVCVNTYVLIKLLEPNSAGWTYPPWLFFSGGIFVVFFLVLNLFWFYKIVSHALALCFRKKKSQQKYSVLDSTALADEDIESLELQPSLSLLDDDLEKYEMA